MRDVLVEMGVAADCDPRAVDGAFHSSPAQYGDVLSAGHYHPSGLRLRQERLSQRMGRLRFQRRGVLQAAILGTLPAGADLHHVGCHRTPFGQGAGFVEGEDFHPT